MNIAYQIFFKYILVGVDLSISNEVLCVLKLKYMYYAFHTFIKYDISVNIPLILWYITVSSEMYPKGRL